jgi:hypothetical protein
VTAIPHIHTATASNELWLTIVLLLLRYR